VAAAVGEVVVMGKVVVMEMVGLNKRVNIKKRLGKEKSGVQNKPKGTTTGPQKPGLEAGTPDPATRRRWIQTLNKPPHALREKGSSGGGQPLAGQSWSSGKPETRKTFKLLPGAEALRPGGETVDVSTVNAETVDAETVDAETGNGTCWLNRPLSELRPTLHRTPSREFNGVADRRLAGVRAVQVHSRQIRCDPNHSDQIHADQERPLRSAPGAADLP
jgi:hypothetical protein